MASDSQKPATTDFESFDADIYSANTFSIPEKPGELKSFTDLILKNLAKFYKTTLSEVPDNSLKILDFGCGPSVPFFISATPKAAEFVLSDYAQSNLDSLNKWLRKDPSAYNWTPYFDHVVQTLEGGTRNEAVQRAEQLRTKVKAVIYCDINQDPVIEESHGNIFDVVATFVCLESGCNDLEAYRCGIKKLSSMIKSGGYFLLCSTRREKTDEAFYFVNGVKFSSLCVKRDFVIETLQGNGLTVIEEDYMESPSGGNSAFGSNTDGYIFIVARKT